MKRAGTASTENKNHVRITIDPVGPKFGDEKRAGSKNISKEIQQISGGGKQDPELVFQNSTLALINSKDATASAKLKKKQIKSKLPLTPRELSSKDIGLEGAKRVMLFMYNCWRNNELCDTVIKVKKGGELECHKLVLAAYSSHLSEKFEALPRGEIISIDLSDFPRDIVYQLLLFMYTTELSMTPKTVALILAASQELQIDYIITEITSYFERITVENCIVLYFTCKETNLTGHLTMIADYICTNISQVIQSAGYLKLSFEKLTLFFEIWGEKIPDQLQIFLAVVKWIDSDRTNRLQYAAPLIRRVKFHQINPELLATRVEKERHIFDIVECHVMLYNAMKFHALKPVRSKKNANKHCNIEIYERSKSLDDQSSSTSQEDLAGSVEPEKDQNTRHSIQNTHFDQMLDEIPEKLPAQADLPRANDLQKTEVNTSQNAHNSSESLYDFGSSDNAGGGDSAVPKKLSKHTNHCLGGTMLVKPPSQPLPPQSCSNTKELSAGPGRETTARMKMQHKRMTDVCEVEKSQSVSRGTHVMVVGGVSPSKASSSRASGKNIFLYNEKQRVWEQYATLRDSLHHHRVEVVPPVVYVIGGQHINSKGSTARTLDGKISRTVHALNTVTMTWAKMACMNVARAFFSTSSCDSFIYATGGESDQQRKLNSIEKYNTRQDRWQHLATLCKGGKLGTATAVHKKYLYIVGGFIESEMDSCPICPDVECFNLRNQCWEKRRPLPAARCYASLAVCSDQLYLIGGRSWNVNEKILTSLPSVEVYNDLSDTWDPVTSLITPRHDFGCAVKGSLLYVIGGMQSPGQDCLETVECYDTKEQIWLATSPLPQPLTGLACNCVQLS